MSHRTELKKKIQDKSATIGVIGLGYVGLPLVMRFGVAGFNVFGFDIDEKKIDCLNRAESYIDSIPSKEIEKLIQSTRFFATSDFDWLDKMDAVIICVPTPLNINREPDVSYIIDTADQIAQYLRPGQLISLESTTYPGTTRELLLPRFEINGMKAGKDFFLAFSPEREDPGNPKFHTSNIPKIVGGITSVCSDLAALLYDQAIEKVISVSSTEVAEFTKLLENIFRSVNIAMVNELKILADKMNLDIWEIIAAASTKPFGFMPFYPGPGLGGHCIPIDPFYLSWKAREYKFNTRFIELAGEVNSAMPDYVVARLMDALNTRGKSLNQAKILILGIAYKKDTNDLRESPGLEIMEILLEKGADLYYHDPYTPIIPRVRKHDLKFHSSDLTENLLAQMDAVMIITDHSKIDYKKIVKHSSLIIDTRNATGKIKTDREKIVKA